MSIIQRTVHSTAYNVTATAIQTLVQFARSVILARLLAPDVFGVYAFAFSLIVATRPLANFGLGGALLHRTRESEGEIALRVHFTLSMIFGLIWALALCGIGFFLLDENRWVLWVLVAAELVNQCVYTARSMLVKRVVFRRIALMSTSTTIVATVVALLLAWQGFGVWSLMAPNVVTALSLVVGFYVYHPVWRPRLGWSADVVRYFISFGRRTVLAHLLSQLLDRVDDLWTGAFLGETPLGFYSRAYRFATYPRDILASPLNAVAAGTYAELKEEPVRLSQAFFRVNSFLVRSGFMLAGLLTLVAPEFIRIVIGAKWLPMLNAFRLMLVFTLLDPIKATIAHLFIAVGCPEKTVRARLVQLVVLVIGLFALGFQWGIAGVAVAVDAMLVVGIGLLLWQAKAYVQFSVRRMFTVPTFALILAIVAARAAITIPGVLGSSWRTGSVKIVVFSTLYVAAIFILERDQIPMLLNIFKQLLPERQTVAN